MQGTKRLDVRLRPAGVITVAELTTVGGTRAWEIFGRTLSDSEAQELFDEIDREFAL